MVNSTPPNHDHFNDYLEWIRSIAQQHDPPIFETNLHDEARQDFDQWDSDELRIEAARAVRQLWSAKRPLVTLTSALRQAVRDALATDSAALYTANDALRAVLRACERGIRDILAALENLSGI